MGRDNQVVVALNPKFTEKASSDPSADYRKALEREGLLLLDPYTRTSVLRDSFLLLKDNPARYTLVDAEANLKARYDSGNILRSRDEVHEALKLIRFSDVVTPRPEYWTSSGSPAFPRWPSSCAGRGWSSMHSHARVAGSASPPALSARCS